MRFLDRFPMPVKGIVIFLLSVGATFGSLWIVVTVYERMAVRYAPVVIPVDETKIIFPLAESVKHFYTYKPYETLVYEIPGSPAVTNRTNNDGLVDRFDYPVHKDANAFRIIAIGDSFTQGIMVETYESYPEVLEDLFKKNNYKNPDIEVLNFGVGGYDIEYALHRLRTQGMKYDPDMILWLVQFNDFYLINEKMGGVRASFAYEFAERFGLDYRKPSRELYERFLKMGEIYARVGKIRHIFDYQASRFWDMRTFFRGPIVLVYFEDDDPMIIELLGSFRALDQLIFLVELPSEISRFSDGHPDKDGHAEIARHVYSRVNSLLAGRENRPLQENAYE